MALVKSLHPTVCFHPTLCKLPGVYVDTYGNLKVKKADKKDCGLRQRINFVMKLKPRFLVAKR